VAVATSGRDRKTEVQNQWETGLKVLQIILPGRRNTIGVKLRKIAFVKGHFLWHKLQEHVFF
jgi:hypothetical protein